MVNLVGAWNNQLLEILGAMGMREVRRLRGEVGRAMFKEDLDKEIFAPLFARPEGESPAGRANKSVTACCGPGEGQCRSALLIEGRLET